MILCFHFFGVLGFSGKGKEKQKQRKGIDRKVRDARVRDARPAGRSQSEANKKEKTSVR
jgi:hypothetical protein